jgi:short-subunit dehydrogenase
LESIENREKTTLIAGISGDLVEVCRTLGARAGKVALLSRNAKKLDQFSSRLINWGIDATSFRADVTDSESVLQAFRDMTAWSRRLDVLIYNVGVISNEAASEVTESELARVMSANFFGFVNCFQLAMPVMKHQGGGHVLILSGSGSLDPASESVADAASKASLQIYTKALRRELRDYKIKITEVYLGRMQSGAGWRWLTCEEIVAGVISALEEKPERFVIGTK